MRWQIEVQIGQSRSWDGKSDVKQDAHLKLVVTTLNKFHIYKISKKAIQIKETYSDYLNTTYDFLLKE
jgi:hypothetical protein